MLDHVSWFINDMLALANMFIGSILHFDRSYPYEIHVKSHFFCLWNDEILGFSHGFSHLCRENHHEPLDFSHLFRENHGFPMGFSQQKPEKLPTRSRRDTEEFQGPFALGVARNCLGDVMQ